jgi:hypothetical protein
VAAGARVVPDEVPDVAIEEEADVVAVEPAEAEAARGGNAGVSEGF